MSPSIRCSFKENVAKRARSFLPQIGAIVFDWFESGFTEKLPQNLFGVSALGLQRVAVFGLVVLQAPHQFLLLTFQVHVALLENTDLISNNR